MFGMYKALLSGASLVQVDGRVFIAIQSFGEKIK